MPAQNACAASAAGAARVNVLPFGVKDHHAAVVVAAGQVKAVLPHLLEDDLLSENAEVARDDEVIILRLPAKVFKMLPDGINSFWQQVILGVLVLVVVYVDTRKTKKKRSV